MLNSFQMLEAVRSQLQAKDQKIIDLQSKPSTTTVYTPEASKVPKFIRVLFGDKI